MKRRFTFFNSVLALCTIVLVQKVAAQTGPGGVGNATGSGGQPANRLWLRADLGVFSDAGITSAANLDLAQQWNDQSGNAFSATQVTSGERPTYRTSILNGLPVLRFNGSSNQMLLGASLNNTNALPLSFFAVTNNTTNPRGLFDSRPNQADVFRFFNDGSGPGANNSVEFWNNNPAKGGINLSNSGSVVSIIGTRDGSNNRQLDAYVTGSQIGAVSVGTTAQVGLVNPRIGSINTNSNWYNGDVAEIIYFTTGVNAAQRIIIENYLGAKYGITLTTNDYYTGTGFSQDVFGIGTTDGTIKHTQANGAGLWLSESSSTLNAANEFVFAGYNGATHSGTAITYLADASVLANQITSRWNREYRLEKTGSVDATLTFDYAQAGFSRPSSNPADYFLLFRSSTTGQYSVVPLSGSPNTSVANRVSFTVLNANLSNGYYTLGLRSSISPITLYTYNTNCSGSCDFEDASSWTTDPSGASLIGSAIPRNIDNIVVLNGNTVNASDNFSINSATLNSGGILDLGTNQTCSFSSLNGAGRLRLATTSGTIAFPFVGTNNFITNVGSTVEYNGSGAYQLPASPSTYRNLVISGGSTKTATIALTVNENFTIEPPTVLNMANNLNVNGNFINNGQFNQTSGTTTFGSNVAQSISGSPILTIFNNLTINNSGMGGVGTVSSSIGFTLTGNFISSSNNTTAFNATAGLILLSSASAQSIGGTGSGAVNFFGLQTDGAGLKIINRNFSVNGTLTIGGSTNLQFPAGGTAYTLNVNNMVLSGTFNMATPGSATSHQMNISNDLTANASSTLNLVNGSNVCHVTFNKSGIQAISATTPSVFDFQNVTVNAGSTSNLTGANMVIQGDLTVNGIFDLGSQTANRAIAGGTLLVDATGNLRLGGTTGFPANYSTITLNSGSAVSYYGASQNVRGLNYQHLNLSGGTKTPLADVTVNQTLTLSTALFDLGNFNLLLPVGSSLSGTFSASNMIRTDGTGSVRRFFDVGGSFTFPLGTGSLYNPATLTISSATFSGGAGSRFVNLRTVGTVAPSQLDASYSIARHWISTVTNLSNVNGSLITTYNASEANLSAEPGYGNAYYDGSSWTTGATSTVVSRVITFTLTGSTLSGNWTAGPNVAFIAGSFFSRATGNFEDANTWSQVGYSGAVSFIPPTTGSTINIGNNRTVTATAGSKNLTTVNIDGGATPGTLDLSTQTGTSIVTLNGSGTLRISAPDLGTAVFPTVTTNNFINTAGNTVEYYGTGNYNLPASPTSYRRLAITGAGSTKLILAATTVSESLVLNSGFLSLGNLNLDLGASATVSGSAPSASNMVLANGTGALRKYFDAIGSFTFPLGNTGVYTPITLNLTLATFGGGAGSRFVAVRPVPTVAPSQLDASWSLTKHWVLSSTNLSAITATLSGTYDLSERNITAEPIYVPAIWTGSWSLGTTLEVSSPVVNFTRTAVANLNGNYTAGPSVAFVAGSFFSRTNGNFEDGATWATGSHLGPTSLIPPTAGSAIIIGNNHTVTATAGGKNLTTLTISGAPTPGTLDLGTQTGITIGTLLGSGRIRITSSGVAAVFPSVSTNTFITTTNSTVEYYGTGTYTLPSLPTSYRILIITGGVKTLTVATSIHQVLGLNGGILETSGFNLSFQIGSSWTGTPSATNMIRSNGSGSVLRMFNSASSFTFPLGTGSVYTPATVNITSATFAGGANVAVRAMATAAPSQLDATYSLTKHWVIASTNMSAITATISGNYDLSERNAAAEPLYISAFHNGAWTTGAAVVSPTISITRTAVANLNGNYTAGPSVAFAAGNFYSRANGNFEDPNTWSLTGFGGAATLIAPTTGSTVHIGNNRTVTNTAGSKTLTTVNLNGAPTPGTWDLGTFTGIAITTFNGSGSLRISASGVTAVFPTIITNNFITAAGNRVEYYGTGTYSLPASPTTYRNLVVTGGTKTLTANTTINTNLNLNGGILNLANFNAIFPVGSTWSGTPSGTNMIQTSGTGFVRRNFDAIGSFTFPVGTGSVYTPATVNMTAATFSGGAGSRFITVRAVNTVAPSQLDASYSLTKHWVTSTTNLSGINASLNFTYDLSERNIVAEPIYLPAYWNGTAWTLGTLAGNVSPVTSFTRTGVANLNGNWTAGPEGAFVPDAYYTIGSGNFEDAANWSTVSYGGAASLIQPTNGSTLYIGDNQSVTLNTGSRNFATVQLDATGIFDVSSTTGNTINTLNGSGRIRITASGGTAVFPTVTINNFISTAGSTVVYYGPSSFNLPAGITAYRNLNLTGATSTKTLLATITVHEQLTMNSGVLALGNFNLILPVTNTLGGNPGSATNMIQTGGTGVVRKFFNGAGSFNFLLGTGSVFSPFNLIISSATFSGGVGTRYVDVRAVTGLAPSALDNTWNLNKYWITTPVNISNVNGSITAAYTASEANATAESIYVSGYWNGSAWATGASVPLPARTVSFSLAGSSLSGNWTAGPAVGFLPGTFWSFADGNYETATTWSLVGYGGPVSPIPPTSGSNVSIGNNRTVTTTAGSKTVPTVTIDGAPTPGTLDIQSFTGFNFTTLNGAGTLRISATGGTAVFPTVTTNNFISTAGSTVEYYGTASYNLPAGITAYRNLALTGTGSVKNLLASTTVNEVLTMNSGVLSIGNFNLILPTTNTLAGSPGSAGNMIRTGGTGVVRKFFDAPGSFNFLLGTGSVFSPFNLIISSATFSGGVGTRYVDVRAVTGLAPSALDNTWNLNKYWITTPVNISNVNGSITAAYTASEANATAESIYVSGYWNGSAWATGASVPLPARTVSFSLAGSSLSGNWTAGPAVGFLPGTFWSFADSNYETATTWSLVGYGGPVSPIPPTSGSNVSIGNNRTVTTTAGSKTVPTVTIDGALTPGTLDIQSFTGFNFTTLNGAGTLRISATGGTAVFPTVATNNFISTSGSTVEYYGTASYNLPAINNYRNLTLTGTGSTKTQTVNLSLAENLVVNSGTLQFGSIDLTVNGTTTNAGTINDNNNTGTNTFTGLITNTGTISTTANSPFVFGGGITNNGTFSKTGNGAIIYNAGTQTIAGSSPISMTGAISLATGSTIINQNNGYTINNINIGRNGRWRQNYASFPTTYTGSNNGLAINTGFEVLSTSDDAGNSITSANGENFNFTTAGAGSVYGVRTINLGPASGFQVVRFQVNTASTVAQTNAATLIIGSGFANNATVHAATARLQFNLNATTGEFTLTHPDGTPTTSGTLTGTQTITWVINTSGASVSYTGPNNGGNVTLANNSADVWAGNNRFVNNRAIQTPAQAMEDLKFVFNTGAGSINLNNISVNPVGTINTSAVSGTCYQVTPYDGDSIQVSFTTPGTMTASTHFNQGNVYTAQLSNASGSFGSPVNIGTLTTTALSGTINAFIPANQASGTGYRVRVVSNAPISQAVDNGTNFIVNQFRISPAPSQVITTSGTGSMLTATGLGVIAYQWGYYTILGGPITDLVGQTAATYTPQGSHFPGAGTYSVVCRMTTSACGVNLSNYVVVYINCPVTTNIVVNGDFSAGNTAFTSEYVYVVDDPLVQNEMWPEGTYAVDDNPRDVHSLFCNMTTPAQRSPGSGGNMLIGNASTAGTRRLWQQNITVTPNTDYVLNFWASSLAGATSSLLFGIYTGCYRTGADVSVPFETVNCQWNRYSFQFNSGNNTTIPLAIVNISAQASGNDIAVDDIEVYACASVSTPPFVVANAPFWRGISSDWFNMDNWGTTCGLPTCADDVYIPLLPSGRVYPVINAAGAAARSMEIRSGAQLTINAGFNLNVCGSLDNQGLMTNHSNSSLTFIGASTPVEIKGNLTGTNRLVNLTINKTNASDSVKLVANLEMTGNFSNIRSRFNQRGFNMTVGGNYSNSSNYTPAGGSLILNGNTNTTFSQTGTGTYHTIQINKTAASNTVTFNPTVTNISNQLNLSNGLAVTSGTNEISVTNSAVSSVVNYSASSYVSGRLRRAISGVQSYDFPVGTGTRYNLINMTTTSNLVGTSTVRAFFNGATATGTIPSLSEGDKFYEYVCANGFWDLTPNVQPSSGQFNITIFPIGLTCSQPHQTIAKRSNSGTAWTFGGSTPVSATSRNGFSNFSEFAQIDAEEPLPLDLISFFGRWKNQQVELQWQTANERDFSHFEIEKSSDGQTFSPIGRMAGKGDASFYQFADTNPQEINYYRLKQVDEDGSSKYSPMVVLRKNAAQNWIQVAPNPANAYSQNRVQMLAGAGEKYRIEMTDMAGKRVFLTETETQSGLNEIEIQPTGKTKFPAGMYTIRIVGLNELAVEHPPVKWVVE